MDNNIKKELKLVDVEKAYNNLKIITIVALLSTSIFFSIAYIYLNNENKEISNRILYLDSQGIVGSGELKSVEDSDIVNIQMKAALKYAVPFMYSFNSSNFDEQIEKALKLYGSPGKEIYSGYINDKVKERIIASNLNVHVKIEDVYIEFENGKNYTYIVFMQSFSSGNNSQSRRIKAKSLLENVKISNSNPFGYLITDWVIINEERI